MLQRNAALSAASFALFFVVVFSTPSAAAAAEPAAAFIVLADSLARSGDDDFLRPAVSDHALLIGAAVGQLLEAAIEASDAGDAVAADSKFDLAERIAKIYSQQSGVASPLELVRTYRSWGEDGRAARRKAKSLEKQAADARAAGDFTRAAGLLEQAMALFAGIGDARSQAVLWGSLGVVCWQAGDYRAVAQHYTKALTARRAIDDRILEGRTLNGLGSVHYQFGDYAAALEYYRQSIALRRRTGDVGGLGTSLTYLGNTYLALGRTVEARNALEEALPLVEQSGDAGKRFEILTSIAGLHAAVGRTTSANDALRDALEIARATNDPVRQAVCHNNLALNLAGAYRYREAFAELEDARLALDASPDPEQLAVFYRNRGVVLLRTGELDRARDDFLALLALSDEHGLTLYKLEGYINIGYLLGELEAYGDGLAYANRASALARETNNPKMVRESAVLAAEMERHLGRYADALDHWQVALEHDSIEGDAACAADRLGMANVHAIAGRPEEARRIYRDNWGFAAETRGGDLELSLLFGMAHTFENTDPDSARHYYEAGLDLLDETGSGIGGAEVKTGYLGGARRHYYEEVAGYYVRLSAKGLGAEWESRAFQTIERAKARGLLSLIEASVLSAAAPEEEAVLDSLYGLDKAAPGYAERKYALENRYTRLRSERVGATMGSASGKAAAPDPADVQKRLPKKTAMLAYALGDSVSFVWAIDRRGTKLFRLPGRGALGPEVERLRDAVARPGPGDRALRASALQLYAWLVAPCGERIAGAETLVIVPDGFLFEVPFEVLLREPAGEEKAWGELAYLARSFSTVYAPSASIYLALADAKKPRRDADLFALGDPDYSLLSSSGSPGERFDPLPHARSEVIAIASNVDDRRRRVRLGAEADEAHYKEFARASSARVVHLAAHGVADPIEPAASKVVLCPDPARTEDGYLHTLEIMSTPIRAGLVVVSACESAGGRVGRGEGVVGLSRAFLAAGAGGVVASLWAVSDESTAALMKEFYKRMFGDKQPAAGALAGARLSLLQNSDYAHPFFWSPFVVIGSGKSP